jgi:four helix bundle protein
MNPEAEQLKQRTFRFALSIIRFCRKLRENWEGRELSDQIFRSGTRVGANYRSACRALSSTDFVKKIGYVVEEADESVYWLDLIRAAAITTDSTLGPLLAEATELSRIFNQSQLTAKTNLAAKRAAARKRRARGKNANA